MANIFKAQVFCLFIVGIFSCFAFAHDELVKLYGYSPAMGDQFGSSVSVNGNIAVVGASQADVTYTNTGAACIFEFSEGEWVQLQRITAADRAASDQFGRSVVVLGDTIFVGAYGDDSSAGSAYVFTRSGGVWSQQQKLTAPDRASGDRFGSFIAIDNDRVVISAYGDDSYKGSAYVFVKSGSTWIFEQKLTASDAASLDYFGYSVAIDANTILVGAYRDDYSGKTDAGSVYFFEKEGTIWNEKNILRALDGQAADYFGCSIALDSNFAVIGAYECEIGGVSDAGAAYVFSRTGCCWFEQQKIYDANTAGPGDDFGRSVAKNGNTIFAGCPLHVVDTNQVGAVFEFVLNDGVWRQEDILLAHDGQHNDNFGAIISTSGSNLFVGAPFDGDNGESAGAAYVFGEAYSINGDFDCDLDVDFIDFGILGNSWRQVDGLRDIAPEPVGDGNVDFLDFAIFCGNWLMGR